MSKKHFGYMLSDIPNDEEGKAFVKKLKQHFNTDSYVMTVKGQYLKDGLNWRQFTYGQPLKHSKCLRIYIKEKRVDIKH